MRMLQRDIGAYSFIDMNVLTEINIDKITVEYLSQH